MRIKSSIPCVIFGSKKLNEENVRFAARSWGWSLKIDRCHCLFLFASNICQECVFVIIMHASSQFSCAPNVLLVFTYRPCNCLWMSGFYTDILWLVIVQICCCCFFLMLLQICQIHCTPTKYYCHSTWTIKMNHPVTKYQNTARTIIVNIIASIIVGIIVILKYEKNKCSPCSYYRQRYLEQACLRFSM